VHNFTVQSLLVDGLLAHRPELRGASHAHAKMGGWGGVCDPKTRPFWLGGVSKDGQLSEERRAQGQ